jgi:hypothetical protein
VCGACGYCSSDRICLLASAFCCGNVVLKLVIVLMFDAHACAYRDIPYLTLPCLPLPTLPTYSLAFWRFLSLRRYTANGISRMGLRSWWLTGFPVFQNDARACTAPWQLFASSGSSWPCQNSGSSTSPAGKTRESVSHTRPHHHTPSSQSYDLSPIRSQGAKQRQPCIWAVAGFAQEGI